jgi:hypothetical protein
MNDVEYQTQKARLERLIERWVDPLGLHWWHLSFAYVRDDFEVDGKPAPETAGRCTANWRYLQAHIAFNMSRVLELDDEDLEQCFVHELTHVFLNEARESGDDWLDHEERVASTIANAFVWLRRHLEEQAPPLVTNAVVLSNGVSSWAQQQAHKLP